MKDAVLAATMIAVILFGYYIMKHIDIFTVKNSKKYTAAAKKHYCHMSFDLERDTDEIIRMNLTDKVNELYPSARVSINDNQFTVACECRHAAEISNLIENNLSVVENDIKSCYNYNSGSIDPASNIDMRCQCEK